MCAFLFDVDDTIYDQMWPFRKAFDKCFKKYNNIPLEELFQYSRKYSDEVFELTESGELPLQEMHVYRITKAFEVYNIEIEKEEALNFQYTYEKHQKEIQLVPDVEKTFQYCKKNNIKIGIITNGPELHQQNKIDQLGLSRWISAENIFISSKEKVSKPDKGIFEVAEKKMGLVSKDTYFIGDSFANDVTGAKNAGWRSIWINRRNKKIPDDLIQPDYVIKDGDSLLRLVLNLCEQKSELRFF
ncbi:HAD family hydrolase [Desemzia sp. RIT804]|uniref:HAD family hydrolase n=1 Tax=Desemzia sp. RIT 804 TaxID=2810209 RepID=UPI001950E927|nr:HAD family hydrolase [Desemzia sp. RIT 804]MBM6615306.1 HAD family hydrolase [Desemzia sp. RIT 804]